MMMSRIFAIVVNVLTVTLSLRSTSAWVVPSSSLLSVRGTTQFILKSSSIAKSVPGTPALQLRTSRLTLSAVEVAGNGESSTTTTSSSSVSSSIQEQQHLQVVSMENYDENSFNSSNNKLKTVSTTTKSINGESSELSTQQKVINALFLSAAFGYGIYTILNIDSGLTRGWSASEIAMRIPLDNWGAYESYLANKPIVTKTLINVIIYLLGDWLSQTVFQKKNVLDFDISRTLRNGFIGLCFGPCVHQYYEFSDAILPPELGLVTRLEKIVMDQTIYLTVKCSIYICAVGLLAGEDFATVKQRVKDKIVGIVFTAWKFWPLVHCITYSLIPAQHRILWVNSVDLVWNAILSTMAQKKDSVFEELEGEDEKENPNLSAFGTPTPIPSGAGVGASSSFVTLKTFMLVNDTLSATDVDIAIPSSFFQDDESNLIVMSQTNSTTTEALAV